MNNIDIDIYSMKFGDIKSYFVEKTDTYITALAVPNGWIYTFRNKITSMSSSASSTTSQFIKS